MTSHYRPLVFLQVHILKINDPDLIELPFLQRIPEQEI
jgi:hypothetical protein